jgi:hypothetical protein
LAKSKICRLVRKGPADFVSRVDTNAERIIKAELSKARPDWGFEMEESGITAGADPDAPCWIVDPLDGTTNYLHGIPHFAISIAVRDKGKITAALSLTRFAMNISLPRLDQVPMSMTADCAFLGVVRWANLFSPPAFHLSGAAVMKTMRFLPANYSISWGSALACAGLVRLRLTLPMSLQGGLTAIGNMG